MSFGSFKLPGPPPPPPLAPVPGMLLWLKGDGAGNTTSGSNWTLAADQSGNHFDAGPLTGAGTRALQVVPADSDGVPGFQGTQGLQAQGLKYTASNLLLTLAPRTIYAVVKFDGLSTFNQHGGIVLSFRRNSPSFAVGMEDPYNFGMEVNAQRPFTYEQSPVNSMFVTTTVDYSSKKKLFRWQTDAGNPATTLQPFDKSTAIPMQSTTIPPTTETGLSQGYNFGFLIEDNGADVFQGTTFELLVYAGLESAADIAHNTAYFLGRYPSIV